MAGIRTIHVFGREGGFLGADGANPIELQIWVGEGNRIWLEGKSFARHVRPLGQLKTLIPRGPDSPHALLDACIAFHADAFETCPSFKAVEEELGDTKMLDFDLGADEIPKSWEKLREEARKIYKKMPRWTAELVNAAPRSM